MQSVSSIKEILNTFTQEYKKTPTKLKMIDCFLVYGLLTAAVQFAYMVLVGSFPFNSFLAGFTSAIGFFVLTVCLRMQVDSSNREFSNLSPERAFADYVLANTVLHLLVWNFIG